MTDPYRHEELCRFWDEVVQGKPVATGDLEPELARLIRQLHAERDDVVPPDPAYAWQLRKQLVLQARLAGAETLAPLVVSASQANGQPHLWRDRNVPVAETRGKSQRWGLGQFATLGLLLIVLGLTWYVIGPGRSDGGHVAKVPVEETLLTVEIPAEARPPGRIELGAYFVTIPSGTRSMWQPTCCPGPIVEYVVEGAYTVRAEAAIRVVRADRAIEEVPAGLRTTLGPGDALISRNETVVEAANDGTIPVTLLSWVLVDDDTGTFQNHLLPGWIRGDSDGMMYVTIPERPLTVRFERVSLPPKTELPLPPSGTLQFHVTLPEPNADGTPIVLDTSLRTNGAIYNRYDRAIPAYLVTVEFAHDPRQFSRRQAPSG